MRQANQPAAEQNGITSQQGLLGALADTFNELGKQAEAGRSPLDGWRLQLSEGWRDLSELVVQTGNAELARFVIELTVLVAIWGGLLVIFIALGRMLAGRRGWPLDLPREPKAHLLAIHFLRRMLPWALAFALTMGIAQLVPSSAGRTAPGHCLCRAVWSDPGGGGGVGHRGVHARASFRRRADPAASEPAAAVHDRRLDCPGRCLNSSRLTELIGLDLASLCSVLANTLAAVLSGRFILRFKRPIKHLIRNRPYSHRREKGSSSEVIRVVGGLWHVPALLLVGGSLLAIFVTGGDVGTALARSIISAALLVLTLVVAGLLRRHAERRSKRRRQSEYRRRLERFGYALGHALAWFAFAELSLQVWGASLIGIGTQGVASVRIGQALLGIGFTILLAWLVWIFADTAIQRAWCRRPAPVASGQSGARPDHHADDPQRHLRHHRDHCRDRRACQSGVNVTPLLAGAGVIGLAIGFGAQTLVQDLITGIFILIEDSLAVDDFVKINGHMGTVEGLTLRTVRLRDLDGIVHIITFSRIDSIHNMSRQFGIALMKIRIPYDMKIDDAITLMHETARALRQDPMMRHHIWSPLEMQGIHAFEDGCPILRMRFRTAPEMQWDVARAFNLLLKQRMEELEIDLGVPRLSVSMEGRGGGRLDGSSERGDERDASGRDPGEAGIADPTGATSARGASPDPGT